MIEAWFTAIVQDGGVERYDHLHIDKIDARWARREHWLEGGTEAFRLTRRVRDRHGLALIVALAYSLESGEALRGMNFRTPDEFQAQLDWSPPSLYLFHPNHDPWNQSGAEVVKPIDVTISSEIRWTQRGATTWNSSSPDPRSIPGACL